MEVTICDFLYEDETPVFKILEVKGAGESPDLQYIFESIPDEIFSVCISNINTALENNLGDMDIPMVSFSENELVVELERASFIEILENALAYYEDLEDYEKCILINTLIAKTI
jgi:hypothetical protein